MRLNKWWAIPWLTTDPLLLESLRLRLLLLMLSMTLDQTGSLLKAETVLPEAYARVTLLTLSPVALTVVHKGMSRSVLTDPFPSRVTPGRTKSVSLSHGAPTILNFSLPTPRLEKTVLLALVRSLTEYWEWQDPLSPQVLTTNSDLALSRLCLTLNLTSTWLNKLLKEMSTKKSSLPLTPLSSISDPLLSQELKVELTKLLTSISNKTSTGPLWWRVSCSAINLSVKRTNSANTDLLLLLSPLIKDPNSLVALQNILLFTLSSILVLLSP